MLADLVHPGDRWVAAEGGRGGRGNARFLSNRRRAPAFAEQGEVGEERWLRLELKLMADVALVGFPSVGKSTLISVISAAKPKIADYPFTTLEPNLGVVRLDDETEFVVADLPGLIEGASEGRGLGHQFLRHVERARVLVLLLDLSPAGRAHPGRAGADPPDELGDYQPDLLERPRIVVGLAGRPRRARRRLRRATASPRSPARACRPLVGQHGRGGARGPGRAARARRLRRAPAGGRGLPGRARRQRRVRRCVGRQAERAVALSDLTNAEALDEAHRRLRALGVDKALARAGAQAGRHRPHRPPRLHYEDDSSDRRRRRSARRRSPTSTGHIDEAAVAKFCAEAAGLRAAGPPGGARHLGRHRGRPARPRATRASDRRTPSRCRPCRPWARPG